MFSREFCKIFQNTFFNRTAPVVASIWSPKLVQMAEFVTFSWRRSLSYRNQFMDLLCKSIGWFLYDRGLRHEKFNHLILLASFYSLWKHEKTQSFSDILKGYSSRAAEWNGLRCNYGVSWGSSQTKVHSTKNCRSDHSQVFCK